MKKQRYHVPRGMRYSSLPERKFFYDSEFDAKRLRNWMSWRDLKNTVFACIIGRHTGIYPKKYEDVRSSTLVLDDLESIPELRDSLMKYLPEGAYYDRNIYLDRSKCSGCKLLGRCFNCRNFLGQELAFDIDPENITCPIHGSLAEKMRHRQGLSFCMYEFNIIKKEALRLYDYLSQDYSDIRLVYSGRGFHLHVLDKETYALRKRDRMRIAKRVIAENIHIDEWVTAGDMRLIRLPYSLHGMVSRICLPLKPEEVEKFDPVKNRKARPRFNRPS